MTEQNDQLVFEESIEDTDVQESLNIPLNKREILSQLQMRKLMDYVLIGIWGI